MSDKETATMTDADRAAILVARHADDIRYYPRGAGEWWVYHKALGVWRREDARLSHLKAFAVNAGIKTAANVNAAVSLMCGYSQVWLEDLPFDKLPEWLCAGDVMVDLQTGISYGLGPTFYTTLRTPYQYEVDMDFEKDAPQFSDWLDWLTEGDVEYKAYLQRAAGYTMTGYTGERALFFAHGPSTTGKSTFVYLLRSVLGDYAKGVPTDQLLKMTSNAGGGTGLTPMIARLAGARMAAASTEMPKDAVLDAGIVKTLTGGLDQLTARGLHAEAFDFDPQFKIWLFGNEEPVVGGDDPAVWTRIRKLPFVASMSAPKPDFAQRLLKDEGNAILTWCIRGAFDWYTHGLGTCAAVERTTQKMRMAQDGFYAWLMRHTTTEKGAFTATSDLCAAYERTGGEKMTTAKIGYALRGNAAKLGWKSTRVSAGDRRGWLNVRLLTEAEARARCAELARED